VCSEWWCVAGWIGVSGGVNSCVVHVGGWTSKIRKSVEGTSYQDEIDEIEAMGGDPFFLEDYEPDMTIPENVDDGDDNDDETEGDELSKNVWKATDGNGPKQREWDDVSLDEWDGVEIEGAYFDDWLETQKQFCNGLLESAYWILEIANNFFHEALYQT